MRYGAGCGSGCTAAACVQLTQGVGRCAGRFTPFFGAGKERYRRTARRGDLPELASGAFECVVASQTVQVHTAPTTARCVQGVWRRAWLSRRG